MEVKSALMQGVTRWKTRCRSWDSFRLIANKFIIWLRWRTWTSRSRRRRSIYSILVQPSEQTLVRCWFCLTSTHLLQSKTPLSCRSSARVKISLFQQQIWRQKWTSQARGLFSFSRKIKKQTRKSPRDNWWRHIRPLLRKCNFSQ